MVYGPEGLYTESTALMSGPPSRCAGVAPSIVRTGSQDEPRGRCGQSRIAFVSDPWNIAGECRPRGAAWRNRNRGIGRHLYPPLAGIEGCPSSKKGSATGNGNFAEGPSNRPIRRWIERQGRGAYRRIRATLGRRATRSRPTRIRGGWTSRFTPDSHSFGRQRHELDNRRT